MIHNSKQKNLDALYYRKHSSIQFNLALRALSKIKFTGDESILDLGCGDGVLTKYLSSLTTGHIIGIDPDFEMIKLAKKTLESKKISFIQSPAEQINLEQNFDLVTSFSALHWVEDTEAFFKTVKMHLKPKGRAVILAFPLDSNYYNPILEALKKNT